MHRSFSTLAFYMPIGNKARTIMLHYKLFLSAIAKMDDLTLAGPSTGSTLMQAAPLCRICCPLTIWGEGRDGGQGHLTLSLPLLERVAYT